MTALTGPRVFLCGAMVGAGSSLALLLSGIGNVLWPPLWQLIAFYPGLVAGWSFYDCCHQWFSYPTAEILAEAIGIAVVALTYGLLALAGFMAWKRRGPNSWFSRLFR